MKTSNDLVPSPPAGLLIPGVKFGKYEILRRLAKGGMAEIYLARATGIENFEKLLVVKVILPRYVSNERCVRMFVTEARLAATLHHPNITQVFDFGRVGTYYYFTMEYVQGVDVRAILNAARDSGSPVPIEHAISIVAGAAAGLHYAHEKRGPDGEPLDIVHRDISPSNVLVSFDGGIKVADFGIATMSGDDTDSRPGVLIGKVSYMSPEQCRKEPLDRRSDVFALGILLYELTTGRELFHGSTEFDTMQRLISEDVPPPSLHRADYPPGLERIVLRALRRDPDERYSTAQEMQLDLEAFAREHRLVTSSVSLARYLEHLFAEEMDPETHRVAKSVVTRTGYPPVAEEEQEPPALPPPSSSSGPRKSASRPVPWIEHGEPKSAGTIWKEFVTAKQRRRKRLMIGACAVGVAGLGLWIGLELAPHASRGTDPIAATAKPPATSTEAAPEPAAPPPPRPKATPPVKETRKATRVAAATPVDPYHVVARPVVPATKTVAASHSTPVTRTTRATTKQKPKSVSRKKSGWNPDDPFPP